MKKILVFMMVVFSVSFFANAEYSDISEVDANKCKEIADSTKRLACFDDLFTKKADIATESKGNWVSSEKISPIDDSKNITLYLQAEKPIVTSLLGAEYPGLVIRCAEKKTELYVSWGAYLGLDSTQVISRLDADKAKTQNWSISTDNKATFYNGKSIDFIKQLLSKNKLFMKVTPYNESSVFANFNLNGMNEVIKPLREACNW